MTRQLAGVLLAYCVGWLAHRAYRAYRNRRTGETE